MSTIPIHGTWTVTVSDEHSQALFKAIRVLSAEQETLNRWGFHSAELGLAIDDLTELLERCADAKRRRIEFRSQGEWVAA